MQEVLSQNSIFSLAYLASNLAAILVPTESNFALLDPGLSKAGSAPTPKSLNLGERARVPTPHFDKRGEP